MGSVQTAGRDHEHARIRPDQLFQPAPLHHADAVLLRCFAPRARTRETAISSCRPARPGSPLRDTSRSRTQPLRLAATERSPPAWIRHVGCRLRNGPAQGTRRSWPIRTYGAIQKHSSSWLSSFAVRANQCARQSVSQFSNIMLCPVFVRHASRKFSEWLQYVHFSFCSFPSHPAEGELLRCRMSSR